MYTSSTSEAFFVAAFAKLKIWSKPEDINPPAARINMIVMVGIIFGNVILNIC
ncbi:hypothetical protein D3C76_1720380 [compost metagenome]